MLSLLFKVFTKLWYYLVKQANEHYINAALVISLASFKMLCVCVCEQASSQPTCGFLNLQAG